MDSQCPNSRTMITLDDRTYKSGIDEEKDDKIPPFIGLDEDVDEE